MNIYDKAIILLNEEWSLFSQLVTKVTGDDAADLEVIEGYDLHHARGLSVSWVAVKNRRTGKSRVSSYVFAKMEKVHLGWWRSRKLKKAILGCLEQREKNKITL